MDHVTWLNTQRRRIQRLHLHEQTRQLTISVQCMLGAKLKTYCKKRKTYFAFFVKILSQSQYTVKKSVDKIISNSGIGVINPNQSGIYRNAPDYPHQHCFPPTYCI